MIRLFLRDCHPFYDGSFCVENNDQLHNTAYQDKSTDLPKLNWTGSKTALIELIYALHSQGVFDNGNADIKVIAKTFESTFNISLGDFYHTFMEHKSRKISPTKFLDETVK